MFICRNELINKTEELLNNVSSLREKAAKGNLDVIETVEINSLIRRLNKLPLEQQKLIAYKYFENKNQKEISELLFISVSTVKKRLDETILKIGRSIYGIEKEEWDIIYGSEDKIAEDKLIDNIVEKVTKKILKEIG